MERRVVVGREPNCSTIPCAGGAQHALRRHDLCCAISACTRMQSSARCLSCSWAYTPAARPQPGPLKSLKHLSHCARKAHPQHFIRELLGVGAGEAHSQLRADGSHGIQQLREADLARPLRLVHAPKALQSRDVRSAEQSRHHKSMPQNPCLKLTGMGLGPRRTLPLLWLTCCWLPTVLLFPDAGYKGLDYSTLNPR